MILTCQKLRKKSKKGESSTYEDVKVVTSTTNPQVVPKMNRYEQDSPLYESLQPKIKKNVNFGSNPMREKNLRNDQMCQENVCYDNSQVHQEDIAYDNSRVYQEIEAYRNRGVEQENATFGIFQVDLQQ